MSAPTGLDDLRRVVTDWRRAIPLNPLAQANLHAQLGELGSLIEQIDPIMSRYVALGLRAAKVASDFVDGQRPIEGLAAPRDPTG